VILLLGFLRNRWIIS